MGGTLLARIALGLGAPVTILDISAKRLSVLSVFGHQIKPHQPIGTLPSQRPLKRRTAEPKTRCA